MSDENDCGVISPLVDFDSKDIYLRKGDEIFGLHAIGYNEPYEFDLIDLNGSTTRIKTDFTEIEKWGNEYDKDFNMIGRGSFRVFGITLDHAAQEMEADGWVRFEREVK